MNKTGKLVAQVAKTRLERALMTLDKHNRMVQSAKLSKKEREESIKSECMGGSDSVALGVSL